MYDTSIPVLAWDAYLREIDEEESEEFVDAEEDPFGGRFAQVRKAIYLCSGKLTV